MLDNENGYCYQAIIVSANRFSGSYTASFIPPVAGRYAVAVFCGNTPLPGGPFIITAETPVQITDPNKVLILT